MYVCGPTVYNYLHIGNARPLVVFDVLYRLLRRHYRQVCYARNITDIDDKIINASQRENCSCEDISRRYSQAFQNDATALGILQPDHQPRAVEHIEPMLNMIDRLLLNKHAYLRDGHVLFDVSTMLEYGRLSNRSLNDMLSGTRDIQAVSKRNEQDFVLWKPSKPQQPGWQSKWGRGRPGWHIECSAMAEKHLGVTIDIHGGGQDLVFPHHENETAQSECSHGGKPFARHWLHNGHITFAGEKMSKSKGNFITLRDILSQYHGDTVKFSLLSVHYRKPLTWSDSLLHNSQTILAKWYRMLGSVHIPPTNHIPVSIGSGTFESEWNAALEDDLNTPAAFSVLHQMASHIQQSDPAAKPGLLQRFRALTADIGLLQENADQWLHWQPATVAADSDGQTHSAVSEEKVESLIKRRNTARKQRQYQQADKIRQELRDLGVTVEDTATSTNWIRTREDS